jgi:hypothetical protein
MTRAEFNAMADSEVLEYIGMLEAANERLAFNVARLAEAIERTIMENRHLADGDDCTLRHLVRAIGWKPPEQE